eukprot:15452330-Alexandrium_andersonii.AAC.1
MMTPRTVALRWRALAKQGIGGGGALAKPSARPCNTNIGLEKPSLTTSSPSQCTRPRMSPAE